MHSNDDWTSAMTDTSELAATIRDTLYDRLTNSSHSELAFEASSLKAFMLQATDALMHLSGHVERGEITDETQMLLALQSVIDKMLNSMANLEDVRLELQAHRRNSST